MASKTTLNCRSYFFSNASDLGDVAGKFGFGSEEERVRSLLSHFEAT